MSLHRLRRPDRPSARATGRAAVARTSFPLLLAVACASACGAGCTSETSPAGGDAKPPERVPAGGVIRLDGKPLAGAVVTFLPTDEHGTLTVADTKEDGSYELTYLTFPGGTAPGPYKVGVSYLATAEGKPLPLSVRSALSTPPELLNAKELLPDKYSNLGRTILSATVPVQGGTFDFDLEGPLLEFPKTAEPAPPAEPAEPKPAGDSESEVQAAEPARPND